MNTPCHYFRHPHVCSLRVGNRTFFPWAATLCSVEQASVARFELDMEGGDVATLEISVSCLWGLAAGLCEFAVTRGSSSSELNEADVRTTSRW